MCISLQNDKMKAKTFKRESSSALGIGIHPELSGRIAIHFNGNSFAHFGTNAKPSPVWIGLSLSLLFFAEGSHYLAFLPHLMAQRPPEGSRQRNTAPSQAQPKPANIKVNGIARDQHHMAGTSVPGLEGVGAQPEGWVGVPGQERRGSSTMTTTT